MRAITVCVLAGLLALSQAPAPSHASSAFVGATEFTQLANKFQLIESYRKQVEMVLKQVESVRALEKNLERLDPSRAANLLRDFRGVGSIDELRGVIRASKRLGDTLSSLDRDMTTILFEHDRASRIIGNLNSRNVRVTGGEVMRGMHRLARQRGGEYERRVNEYTRAIDSAQRNIERIEKISRDAPQVESSVQGLAALQVSSSQMLTQLADMQVVNAQAALDTAKLAAVADAEALDRVEKKVGEDILLMDLLGAEAFQRAKQQAGR